MLIMICGYLYSIHVLQLYILKHTYSGTLSSRTPVSFSFYASNLFLVQH